MTSASVFTRDLLLAVNGVWVEEVLARRFGRVPEGVPDLIAVLESAAGRGFESVSTLSVDVRVSRRCDDGAWEARRQLWYAADFEGQLTATVRESHQLLSTRLQPLYGEVPDIVYLGGDDPIVRIRLEMLVANQADSDQTITIVRLPGEPAISDPRFQEVDAVADLGAFPGLDFTRKPARNGSAPVTGGEERQVTEIEAGGEIDLLVSTTGPLFEERGG